MLRSRDAMIGQFQAGAPCLHKAQQARDRQPQRAQGSQVGLLVPQDGLKGEAGRCSNSGTRGQSVHSFTVDTHVPMNRLLCSR